MKNFPINVLGTAQTVIGRQSYQLRGVQLARA